MRGRAAPVAEHAEAVRVVDDQPGVVRFRELEQRRQRRDVAVHREHGVGCDDLAARFEALNRDAERGDVRMRIADVLRARQQHRVVQARVVEAIGEHRRSRGRRAM